MSDTTDLASLPPVEEVKAIRKVKDNLAQWLKDEAFHTIAGACGDLIRVGERQAARIGELEKALRPFAEEGKTYEGKSDDDWAEAILGKECLITVGDFRAASRALSPAEGKKS